MEHTKATRTRKARVQSLNFEVAVNGRSYEVSATPYTLPTGEMHYRISYNNGPVHIFGWDEGLGRFAEADDTGELIPPIVEMEIAKRLTRFTEEQRHAA